jgi:subtilisin family serine protease
VDIDVAIIDGGFEFTHPDLDLRPGKDCRNVGFATKNNHGTAVAGVLVVDNVSALPGGTHTEN